MIQTVRADWNNYLEVKRPGEGFNIPDIASVSVPATKKSTKLLAYCS